MNPLRFFADHCVPTSIISTLRESGYEVFRLREHIPKDSPDEIVIATAQQFEAILLSLNGDFADIITYPPINYKGIMAIQVHNHPEIIPQLMKRLLAYVSQYPSMEYYARKLFVVEVHRIRIRQ